MGFSASWAEEEWVPNMRATVLEDARLQEEASAESRSLGRIPEGTVVIFVGEKKGAFVLVEVRLRSGRTIGGWVKQSQVEPDARSDDLLEVATTGGRQEKRNYSIPEDESLLLGRKASLFYGVQVGANYGIQLPENVSDTYKGIGFGAGAHLGFFLSEAFPLRFEVNFLRLLGTSSSSTVTATTSVVQDSLEVGFIEIAAIPSWMYEQFEFSVGLSLMLGSSLGTLPPSLSATSLTEPGDLTSIWAQLGVGYHFKASAYLLVVPSLKYAVALKSSPSIMNYFAAQVALQLRI